MTTPIKAIPRLNARDLERFYDFIEVRGDDECWPWTGRLFKDGYGEFTFRGVRVRAHRVAWRIVNGPIPFGRQILHSCDVSACCNERHLHPGSHVQNMRESAARKTYRGTAHHNAKLNPTKVRAIKRRFVNPHSIAQIARDFNVSENAILRIKRKITWRHI